MNLLNLITSEPIEIQTSFKYQILSYTKSFHLQLLFKQYYFSLYQL